MSYRVIGMLMIAIPVTIFVMWLAYDKGGWLHVWGLIKFMFWAILVMAWFALSLHLFFKE